MTFALSFTLFVLPLLVLVAAVLGYAATRETGAAR